MNHLYSFKNLRKRQIRSLDESETDDDWRDRHFSDPEEFESDVFEQGGEGGGGDGTTDSPTTASPVYQPTGSPTIVLTEATDVPSADDGEDGGTNEEESDDQLATAVPSELGSTPVDGNSTLLPPCRVNDKGEFFVNPQVAQDFAENGDTANDTTAVIYFIYQVQGTLTLTVDMLQSTVLQVLERQLSANLVPELFAPQFCRHTTTSVQTAEYIEDFSPGIRHQRRNLNSNSSNGGSLLDEAPLGDTLATGLQPTPNDTLLRSYEGGKLSFDDKTTHA
jgi:hypothetical protein